MLNTVWVVPIAAGTTALIMGPIIYGVSRWSLSKFKSVTLVKDDLH